MSNKVVFLLFVSFVVLCQGVETSDAGKPNLYRFPTIEVLSPNGGEEWCVDSSYNITWKSRGWIRFVRIEYLINSDSTWETITKFTRNDGSYLWEVPDEVSDDCLVRVSARYGWVSDESDSVFSVVSDSNPPDSSYIIVMNPNGGETWYADTVNYIEWDSYGTSGMLKIEYTASAYFDSVGADSVLVWETIVDSVSDTGFFAWFTPADISSDYCKVRIMDIDGDPADESNGIFSIVPSDTFPNPYLSVTSPASGDTWYSDTVNFIVWDSYGTSGFVSIEYCANLNDTIGDSVLNWVAIADSVVDSGYFDWFTPSDISSENCMIRVADIDGIPIDVSGVFSILPHDTVTVPYIVIESPNGGEAWYADTVNYIEWDSYGTSGILRIEYTVSAYYDSVGGDSLPDWVVITDSAIDDGSYVWVTPPDISSNNCLIRITDIDGSPSDASDDVFSIVIPDTTPDPYITVISPSGGETWYSDSVNYIEWNSYGTSGMLKIEYTLDASYDSIVGDTVINWVTIVDSTEDDGSFDWFIPFGISSEDCMIRIENTDGSPMDISGIFSITSTDSFSISSVDDIILPDRYALSVKSVISGSKLTVDYALPRKGSVNVGLYDISGKKVKEISENKPAGFYSISFDMNNSPQGVYFVRIQANGSEFIASKKTVIIR